MNDKTFQLTQNTTSTPIRVYYSENENPQILIKLQEEFAKQADMIAKLDNKISTLENKKPVNYYNPCKKKLEIEENTI